MSERTDRLMAEITGAPHEKSWVEVELHSTHPDAVAATRATFAALPAGVGFKEESGRFYVTDGFGAFAAERQGYVKRVIREATPHE